MKKATTVDQTEELAKRAAANIGVLAGTTIKLDKAISELQNSLIYISKTEPATTCHMWIKPIGE